MPERAWTELLDDADRALLERARFGRRIGLGARPALLVIDVQRYMVGPPPGSPHEYPSACETAGEALPRIAALAEAARAAGAPVVYTRNEFARDGSDIGVYGRKRDLLQTEGWCLAGSEGAQIHPAVAPQAGDLVLPKRKPSAFHGTPLVGLLIDRGVDTVIVTGGSTGNCVRATAVDASSYDFRTAVVEDCVFDRFRISHLAALFDLDRQYADVVTSADALAHLDSLAHARA
ncbi:MAG TPA: isochorismatase family protein [Gaiellaceae bacterium]